MNIGQKGKEGKGEIYRGGFKGKGSNYNDLKGKKYQLSWKEQKYQHKAERRSKERLKWNKKGTARGNEGKRSKRINRNGRQGYTEENEKKKK